MRCEGLGVVAPQSCIHRCTYQLPSGPCARCTVIRCGRGARLDRRQAASRVREEWSSSVSHTSPPPRPHQLPQLGLADARSTWAPAAVALAARLSAGTPGCASTPEPFERASPPAAVVVAAALPGPARPRRSGSAGRHRRCPRPGDWRQACCPGMPVAGYYLRGSPRLRRRITLACSARMRRCSRRVKQSGSSLLCACPHPSTTCRPTGSTPDSVGRASRAAAGTRAQLAARRPAHVRGQVRNERRHAEGPTPLRRAAGEGAPGTAVRREVSC